MAQNRCGSELRLLKRHGSVWRGLCISPIRRTEMTEDDARRKLVEIDHRYRVLIHSSQELGGETRRKYFTCQQEFSNVRREYPLLSAELEEKYRQACARRLRVKNRRRNRNGQPVENRSMVPTTSDLLNFAYRESLDLFGQPKDVRCCRTTDR
jgi:hypothetical protein